MASFLIATDEAGYGPKLGPLVIAGSLWRIPDGAASGDDLSGAFHHLAEPLRLRGHVLRVDDSKRVYQPGKGLAALEAMVAAGLMQCGIRSNQFLDVLSKICPNDLQTLRETPWLFQEKASGRHDPKGGLLCRGDGQGRELGGQLANELKDRWFCDELDLIAIETRSITARSFNQICSRGYNKSDLLSMLTIELVANLVDRVPGNGTVDVFCDRHGGRRYYAGVLQNQFSDGLVRVIEETKESSVYEMDQGRPRRIHFTVKGDRFTPVAYSSLVAKFLRERFMERLNDYFVRQFKEDLKPTAGYPVDAERFLRETETWRRSQGILDIDLIRQR